MSPRLKLMFILTPVTIGIVGLLGEAWLSYQLEKKGREQYNRDRIQDACTTVQGLIRNGGYFSYEEDAPGVEIGGPESIVPIISHDRGYLAERDQLKLQGLKEQSGLLLDRWGNPLDCKPRGEGEYPDVWSYGPDGENGTEDDIHGNMEE